MDAPKSCIPAACSQTFLFREEHYGRCSKVTKVCTKCGIEKPLEEFNRHKLGKFGRRPECRECQKKEHEAYRRSEHGRAVRRAWKKTEKGRLCQKRYRDKPETKEYMRTYQQSNKYKVKRQIKIDRERFGGNRLKVLERDGFKCVMCGSTDRLQVHHKDGNGRNKPKEQQNHDLDNLITLCAVCHIKEHNPIWHRWG